MKKTRIKYSSASYRADMERPSVEGYGPDNPNDKIKPRLLKVMVEDDKGEDHFVFGVKFSAVDEWYLKDDTEVKLNTLFVGASWALISDEREEWDLTEDISDEN